MTIKTSQLLQSQHLIHAIEISETTITIPKIQLTKLNMGHSNFIIIICYCMNESLQLYYIVFSFYYEENFKFKLNS